MLKHLDTGIALGAAVGAAISSVIYGGLGFWIAGTPGLICGLVLAAALAITGLCQMLKFAERLADFEATSARLEESLRQPLP